MLKPMASLPILTTNEVTISGVCSSSVTAIFNVISTQHVSDALKGKVNTISLLAAIKASNAARAVGLSRGENVILTFLTVFFRPPAPAVDTSLRGHTRDLQGLSEHRIAHT